VLYYTTNVKRQAPETALFAFASAVSFAGSAAAAQISARARAACAGTDAAAGSRAESAERASRRRTAGVRSAIGLAVDLAAAGRAGAGMGRSAECAFGAYRRACSRPFAAARVEVAPAADTRGVAGVAAVFTLSRRSAVAAAVSNAAIDARVGASGITVAPGRARVPVTASVGGRRTAADRGRTLRNVIAVGAGTQGVSGTVGAAAAADAGKRAGTIGATGVCGPSLGLRWMHADGVRDLAPPHALAAQHQDAVEGRSLTLRVSDGAAHQRGLELLRRWVGDTGSRQVTARERQRPLDFAIPHAPRGRREAHRFA